MNPATKMRFSIKLKLLIMIVVIVCSIAAILTFVNLKWFTIRMTESVNSQLTAVSEDVANQIKAINTNELTKLTVLSQVDFSVILPIRFKTNRLCCHRFSSSLKATTKTSPTMTRTVTQSQLMAACLTSRTEIISRLHSVVKTILLTQVSVR